MHRFIGIADDLTVVRAAIHDPDSDDIPPSRRRFIGATDDLTVVPTAIRIRSAIRISMRSSCVGRRFIGITDDLSVGPTATREHESAIQRATTSRAVVGVLETAGAAARGESENPGYLHEVSGVLV